MSKYVKKMPLTGNCTIYIDRVVRDWNDKWFIVQWLPAEFRLCGGPDQIKVTISPDTASKLIKKLSLVSDQSFFKSGITWKTRII